MTQANRRWRRTAAPLLRSMSGGNSGAPFTLDFAFFRRQSLSFAFGGKNFGTMKTRIVQIENGCWRISSGKRGVGTKEHVELSAYLKRSGLPHKLIDGKVCIPASVGWTDIDKKLVPFYDGKAEVTPF